MDNDCYVLTVGIDCGSAEHQVCVLDRERRLVADRRFAHSGQGLLDLIGWILTHGEDHPARVHVAIEVPRGPVVETLLERGFPVWALNPRQLDRFRERYTAAGAKDDRRDAWVLGSALQTDLSAFRALRVDDPAVIALRELSRLDSELGEELTRVSNRLRDQLHRFFPQMLQLCPAANEPWLWQLLALVPTPSRARQVRPAAVQRVLTHARIRRVTGAEVVQTLRTPALHVAPGTVEAASQRIAILLPQLTLLHEQRRDVGKRLADRLDALTHTSGQEREHHDVTILRSWPGIGIRIAATMLAEAPDALRRRDYHALRSLGGLAPVTAASGKYRLVKMRHACNTRLRTALYHWARVATQTDGHARAHYTRLRGRGHTHARSLRGVADRQLAVLVAMLNAGTLYDVAQRKPLATAA
jgi:transposase